MRCEERRESGFKTLLLSDNEDEAHDRKRKVKYWERERTMKDERERVEIF